MTVGHLGTVDLNLLVVLQALLEEGSVTRAAARLGRTQSGVSRSLSRLRTLLDDPLFVRESGTMRPTARASALAGPTSAVLLAIEDQILSPARFDPTSSTRTFGIQSSDLGTAFLLPRVLARVIREAPHIELVLNPPPHLEPDLRLGSDRDLEPTARRVRVGWIRFLVVARKAHPQIQQSLDLDRFTDATHVLVAPRGEPGGIVDHELRALGRSRHVAIRTRSFQLVSELVARSDMIATVPAVVAQHAAASSALQVLEPPLPIPPFAIYLCWPERRHHDEGHRWLRQAVLDEVRSVLGLNAEPASEAKVAPVQPH